MEAKDIKVNAINKLNLGMVVYCRLNIVFFGRKFTTAAGTIASGTSYRKQSHYHKITAQKSTSPLVVDGRLSEDDTSQNEVQKSYESPVSEKIVEHKRNFGKDAVKRCP